ncbi:MAG: MotA/TolQ/ExbB proton channel family protein [Bryobacteraceae bacterium]|nr:MotA/TolQ/ExbB proton channel family protein [Bryobacteraceae bacterium]
MVATSEPIPLAVMAFLAVFSVVSWAIIFSKWGAFRRARQHSRDFLRAFRKAPALDAVAQAAGQYKESPLSLVFDFGYSEVSRQVTTRGRLTNKTAIERTLLLGISEELAKLERNMNWLATTATVSPFIGLFGTVWGIIDAFQAIGLAGSTSMRTVAPGIAHALVATALGLFAAIPAAVFYNLFGQQIREFGARMDDFSLEFLNMTERNYEL